MSDYRIQPAAKIRALWAALAANLVHGALADGTTADFISEVFVFATLLWLISEAWADRKRPHERRLNDEPAYIVGALSLGPLRHPEVVEVRARITRGIHDDGDTYNARVVSYRRDA